MAHSTLLAGAIADAKQVRETALAQARQTLQETFQPTLQRMVSSKLQEEDDEEMDDIDIEIELPEEEPEAPAVGFGASEAEDEEEVETPEQSDEEFVESILRELDGEDDEMMAEEDDVESLDEMDDEMIDESDDAALEDEIMEILMSEMDGEEMLDEENTDDGGAFTEPAYSPELNTEIRRLKRQVKKLTEEKNDALKAVTVLKSAINETNLLNAKLMFTTKTLHQFPLNENQQTRILESFDRAKNVREVKLVYTTICESFNKKPSKSKLSEGLASKPIKPIKAKQLNESDNTLRWRQLAGIAKIEY